MSNGETSSSKSIEGPEINYEYEFLRNRSKTSISSLLPEHVFSFD